MKLPTHRENHIGNIVRERERERDAFRVVGYGFCFHLISRTCFIVEALFCITESI